MKKPKPVTLVYLLRFLNACLFRCWHMWSTFMASGTSVRFEPSSPGDTYYKT